MATKGKSAEVVTQTMSKPKSDVKKSAMKSARRRISGEKRQLRKLAKLKKYIAHKLEVNDITSPLGGRTLSRQRRNLSRRIFRATPEGQAKHEAYLKRRDEKEKSKRAPAKKTADASPQLSSIEDQAAIANHALTGE